MPSRKPHVTGILLSDFYLWFVCPVAASSEEAQRRLWEEVRIGRGCLPNWAARIGLNRLLAPLAFVLTFIRCKAVFLGLLGQYALPQSARFSLPRLRYSSRLPVLYRKSNDGIGQGRLYKGCCGVQGVINTACQSPLPPPKSRTLPPLVSSCPAQKAPFESTPPFLQRAAMWALVSASMGDTSKLQAPLEWAWTCGTRTTEPSTT